MGEDLSNVPMSSVPPGPAQAPLSRRVFLQAAGTVATAMSTAGVHAAEAGANAGAEASTVAVQPSLQALTLHVNGQAHELMLEPRVTLLDALREQLGLMGTKKGCDRGQCGACTVLIDGRRSNACLTLAVMRSGAQITTIEGLGTPGALHPLQAAFIEHDAFQCGYCTPGQICSAVGLIGELKANHPSAATPDVRVMRTASGVAVSDAEIRERMSGNLCRCGAYPNIVAAVREVATKELA